MIGREKLLLGKDFADGLVSKVAQDTYGYWDKFESEINGLCGVKLGEEYAPFLILGTIVMDLQAIKNLRGDADYLALRQLVLDRLLDLIRTRISRASRGLSLPCLNTRLTEMADLPAYV